MNTPLVLAHALSQATLLATTNLHDKFITPSQICYHATLKPSEYTCLTNIATIRSPRNPLSICDATDRDVLWHTYDFLTPMSSDQHTRSHSSHPQATKNTGITLPRPSILPQLQFRVTTTTHTVTAEGAPTSTCAIQGAWLSQICTQRRGWASDINIKKLLSISDNAEI